MKFITITSMFVSVSVAAATPKLRSLTNKPSGPFNCGNKNPCDPLLVEDQFYYPAFEAHKFVQCSEYGDCDVMPCPTDEVWSEEAYTCIWSPIPSSMPTAAPTCYSCDGVDPCSPLAVAGKYYYGHCDSTKYIQCSASGGCTDTDCAPGTAWDDSIFACVFV